MFFQSKLEDLPESEDGLNSSVAAGELRPKKVPAITVAGAGIKGF